jgi:hypothetical protein
LEWLIYLGAVGTSLILTKYLPSYMSEKAKNLATKEDIEEITKKVENIKKDNQIELSKIQESIDIKIELEKLKSKNTELYFQKQLEATKELYKLRSKILPEYRMPDMDWDDACQDIAHNFKEIEEDIENYTIEYFSVLSKDIISKIDAAKNSASEGKFEDPSDLKSHQLADSIWKRIDEANSELKAYVELQIHNKTLERNS